MSNYIHILSDGMTITTTIDNLHNFVGKLIKPCTNESRQFDARRVVYEKFPRNHNGAVEKHLIVEPASSETAMIAKCFDTAIQVLFRGRLLFIRHRDIDQWEVLV